MKKLRVGMIVSYKTNAIDQSKMAEHRSVCNVREELPAVVVAVDEDTVNLKLILDGQGDHWVTSVYEGEEEGEWSLYPDEELNQTELDAAFERVNEAKKELQELINSLSEIEKELAEELVILAAKYEEAKKELVFVPAPVAAENWASEPEVIKVPPIKVMDLTATSTTKEKK